MSTFANSEDPDEIIAEIKTIKREEIHHNLKLDPPKIDIKIIKAGFP